MVPNLFQYYSRALVVVRDFLFQWFANGRANRRQLARAFPSSDSGLTVWPASGSLLIISIVDIRYRYQRYTISAHPDFRKSPANPIP